MTGAAGRLTRFNARLARYGAYLSVTGLLVIVAVVAWQVFGRYVLNSSPTWAENLALVLILYVTLIGAAVGVRDAGHIGMDSILVLLFGVAMAYNGWVLGASVASYKLANIDLSEAWRFVPLVVSGAMIVLFCIEHLVALWRGEEVEPAWH